jgi:hypothetical protein
MDMDGSNTPSARRSLVLQALENLPSQDACFGLLGRYKNTHINMADVLVRHAIETLWQTFNGVTNKHISHVNVGIFVPS